VRLAEAPSHGKPALSYDPRSRGAEAYIKLAKEIMDHVLTAAPAEIADKVEQPATT
jgi:chromosome partitioning protein